jgi:hypothetical protein
MVTFALPKLNIDESYFEFKLLSLTIWQKVKIHIKLLIVNVLNYVFLQLTVVINILIRNDISRQYLPEFGSN